MEAVKLTQSPIFEQIEWPYGGTSSWTSGQMRGRLPSNQETSFDAREIPLKDSNRTKLGLNHDIRSVEQLHEKSYKELRPTELPISLFNREDAANHRSKKTVMS